MALGQGVQQGRALGHYRIGDKLGAGGMGEVYRGHDEHLDRDVAIKVLPAGTVADEAARKRFRKEALSLSRLNHPNIATVYDFNSEAGIDYLVMEYIAGQTLSDALVAGPMPEPDIARFALQFVEGLAAAHEHGVVHRDLKPANLRITTDGRVKVLDFGLSKLVRPVSAASATDSLSEPHAIGGTLPYMSPEQLQGKEVDSRSDIYAAGIVLYEMATGRLPFRETLPTVLADEILHKSPPPPGRLRPELSPRLEQIVLKCLEKNPADRYQNARDLLIDLRRLSAPITVYPAPESVRRRRLWPWVLTAAIMVVLAFAGVLGYRRWSARTGIQSLAVLPIANLSQDPEQEYFADGMTDSLIADLSKIGALRVISRTSVLQYKNAKRPLPEIARELGVDAVIEGSVLRVGDRVRITAQLIAANPERHLWANSYDRELRDILALHSEVAQAIAGEIRVQITPVERARLSTVRPVIPEAHEAYLRGRYYATRFTPEPLQRARQYLEDAVQKDPTYAPAWAELAHVYIKLSGVIPSTQMGPRRQELLAQALAAARKALQLDPESASAHMMVTIATVFTDWKLGDLLPRVKRAFELGPNDADVLMHGAVGLALLGHKDEAMAAAQHALELEPVNYEINHLAGQVYMAGGKYDRAITVFQKALELDPHSPGVYFLMARAYEFKGSFPEAVAARVRTLQASGVDAAVVTALEKAYLRQGMRGVYRWELEGLQKSSPDGLGSPAQQAGLYAVLGQKEKAFEMLDVAYQRRDDHLLTLGFNRRFAGLRSEPRFQEWLRRLNLAEQ